MNGCIARRLKKMNNPVAASLGLSTGIACFPQDATTVDDLVRIADTALYDAKRATQARRATQQGQAIDLLASPSGTLDENQQRVLSAAAGSLAAILQDVSVPDILADLDLRTIAAIGAAAEIKDPYIRKHQERVSQWAAALAEEMGLPLEQVHDIRVAGLLHDLGKVTVSEHILNKPGKLTQEEYAKIKEHSALGAMIVAHVEGLQRLVKIVRHHHERFDGKGYPDGLAGEDIPREARILGVVDVFDAMTHQRSYRKALSKAEAMAELERGAGTQFDPAAVKAFLALLKKRGDDLACPVHAASEARPLVTAKAAGRRKG
jgi:putative nucleotidyltransferase with HDIG domain